METTTNPRGFVTRFVYDPLNWQTEMFEAANVYATGQADNGGSPTTLFDQNPSWAGAAQVGRAVTITAGSGIGETRTITLVGSNTLTVTPNWTTIPDQTSTYQIIPAEQRQTTTEYDEEGNVVIVTTGQSGDPTYKHPLKTLYTYDSLNRPIKTVEALFTSNSRTSLMSYDASGNLLRTFSGIGSTAIHVIATSYRYDTLSRRVETTEAAHEQFDGLVTENSLDTLSDDSKSWTDDILGGRTVVILNGVAAGQSRTIRENTDDTLHVTVPWQPIPPLFSEYRILTPTEQRTRTVSYDANDNVRSVTVGKSGTDPFVLTSMNSYDFLDRPLTTSAPLQVLDQGQSNHESTYTTLKDPNKSWVSNSWAERGVLITGGKGVGQFRVILSNDTNTLMLKGQWETAPDETSTYQIVTGDARNTSTVHDLNHNVKAVIDPLGQVAQYGHDDLDRLVHTVDARGALTRTGLDASSNLRLFTDSVGNATRYVRDALNRVVTETTRVALNQTTTADVTRSFAYDVNSNLISATDRNNRPRTFTFDALDRSTKEVWLNGGNPVHTITTTYDAADLLLKAQDANSVNTYTYDVLGRTTSVSNAGTPNAPTVVLQNTYNTPGLRTRLQATINGTPDVIG